MDDLFQSGRVGAAQPADDTHRSSSGDRRPLTPRRRPARAIDSSNVGEPGGWLHLIGPGTFLAAPYLRSSLLGHALASSDWPDPPP